MLRLVLLTGAAGLLLGSAVPPPADRPAEPRPAPDPKVIEALAIAPPQPAPQPAAKLREESPPVPAGPTRDPLPETGREEVVRPKAPAGRVHVVVSLPLQKAYVFEDGRLLWTSPVSTGKKGHETPTGTFWILQKKVHHRSNKYDDAPMPYMQRLTWYGVALHAGRVPGYPASHGCIRFPRKLAKRLYGLTDFSSAVTITGRRLRSAKEAGRIA